MTTATMANSSTLRVRGRDPSSIGLEVASGSAEVTALFSPSLTYGRKSASFLALLARDVERGHREGLQSRLRDRLAAALAVAIGARVDALDRPLDLGQQIQPVRRDRQFLLPLERLAAGIGLIVAGA